MQFLGSQIQCFFDIFSNRARAAQNRTFVSTLIITLFFSTFSLPCNIELVVDFRLGIIRIGIEKLLNKHSK